MSDIGRLIGEAFGGAVKSASGGDFTVLGIPFDDKSSYQRGTSGGPDAVRKVSTVRSVNAYTALGIDLGEDIELSDAGNLEFGGNIEVYFTDVSRKIAEIARGGSVPVVIGGDHSITFPVIRGMREVHEKLNVIWLDAHPDIYDEFEGDKFSHACPLSRVLELGGIENVYQGGIRATAKGLEERLKEHGVHSLHVDDIQELHGLSLDGKTYLTIDIDVLDPAYAPGCGNPVAGGISTRELLSLIRSFDLDIAGFDVVEVNPQRDCSEITASAAAKIVMETIGSIASRKLR